MIPARDALIEAHGNMVLAEIHEMAADAIDHISAKVEFMIKADQQKRRREREKSNARIGYE